MHRKKSTIHHLEWLDLSGNGTLTECAIMKEERGNIFHIQLTHLDDIDKKRLVSILSSRNASTMELWDLMMQVTLGNGINALDYFHQLVKVITPSGEIMDPMSGRRGIDISSKKTIKQKK